MRGCPAWTYRQELNEADTLNKEKRRNTVTAEQEIADVRPPAWIDDRRCPRCDGTLVDTFGDVLGSRVLKCMLCCREAAVAVQETCI